MWPTLTETLRGHVAIYLRLALAAGFLTSMSDRFGLWGPSGTANVAWGSFQQFAAYTGQLNPWAPAVLIPPLAWFVTVAETVFGIALLLGLRTREVALASGVLLGLFALGLTVGTGLKSALNYSVFAASTGALALATERSYRWSLDALLASRVRGEGERAAGRRQQREYICRKYVVHPATRTEGLAMMDVILKRFEAPDETRVLTKGEYEIVRRGGMTIGRATYEPGWKWSSHIGPSVGASHCTVEHVGLVLSGTATAAFADGRVTELRAGELFYIPGVPHDS